MNKTIVKEWQKELDTLIFRMYSTGTKIKWMSKASRLTLTELAIVISGGKYLDHLTSLLDEVIPAEWQLAFLKHQAYLYVDIPVDNVFREKIQNYHINKDHKAFELFCYEYYAQPETPEIPPFGGYDVETEIDTNIETKNIGDVVYNIGRAYNEINGYVSKGITLEEMVQTNPRYVREILKYDNNYFYEAYYPWLQKRLKERWDWNIELHPDLVKRLKEKNDNI